MTFTKSYIGLEAAVDDESIHAHWDFCYCCSNCGHVFRDIAKTCPFCTAIMDGADM